MERLLVIEDELPMRTALSDALGAEGYRVLTAADGETGLRRAIILLVAVVLTWGLTWPVNKVILQSLSPPWSVALRSGIAAVVLFGISLGLSLLTILPLIGGVISFVVSIWIAVIWLYVLPLIADQGHNRVIEIDRERNIVWEQGGFGYPAKAYRFN